jgi:two-component system, NarL family, nitrate/nitrite response regulator NarL
MSDAEIRVLLADGHSLFREAMRVVLDAQDDVVVVAEAADGVQALAEARLGEPNVALVNLDLPNSDGLHTTASLVDDVPSCRVLVLSEAEDEEALLQALEAGATGFLTKSSPIHELLEATRRVREGETVVPPRMLGALLGRLIARRRERDQALRLMARLTPREREVLALLARGADNAGIAQALVISPETARTHVQNVLNKLGVHSRLEAAAFVTQNGLLEELIEVHA